MPKPPKATAATAATFTPQEIRESFNAGQTSLWEKGVERLCSQCKIEDYIRFLTGLHGEVDKWVAEFSALVDYLGRKGRFYLYDQYFINAIEITVKYHRRIGAEAIITQKPWDGLDPTRALWMACIPYATARFLTRIGDWPAGNLAVAEYLGKDPDRHEKMETKTQYYVNRQAELFGNCCIDAKTTAEENNHHRWLSEPLMRRIYVGYTGLNEWDVENEEVRQKMVGEVLQLIKDRASKIQEKWDNDIKALRRPDHMDADADSRTLVDLSVS
jgi:hypothetical protein